MLGGAHHESTAPRDPETGTEASVAFRAGSMMCSLLPLPESQKSHSRFGEFPGVMALSPTPQGDQ